jgi:hypothetical protein
MDQVSIKYTNIFHCKTHQNFPKFGFLVWEQTIWQPYFVWQNDFFDNLSSSAESYLISNADQGVYSPIL